MEYTSNYNLNKPEYTETSLIDDINDNMDTIDSELAAKLPLSGGTMTGKLVLAADPTADMQAATRQYVDDAVENISIDVDSALSSASINPVQNKVINAALDEKLDLSGGTLTGDLTANGAIISGSTKIENGAVYADTLTVYDEAGAADGSTLKVGNITTAAVVLSADPSTNMQAATVKYVNDAITASGGVVVDSAIDSTSENPVQNKVISEALTNLETTAKNYADSIKTTVDSAMDGTSENPVQNKVISAALDGYLPLSGGTMTGTLTFDVGEDIRSTDVLYIYTANGTVNMYGKTSTDHCQLQVYEVTANVMEADYLILPLTDPTASSHATTKLYVDNAVSEAAEGKRTYVVVAASNTKNPLKANADYTVDSDNDASTVLQTAVDSLAVGGKVVLLDGDYYLTYGSPITIATECVTIEGSGHDTRIYQGSDSSAGEANCIFNITANDVHIEKMQLRDVEIDSPAPIIIQAAQGAVYDGVFFIYNCSSDDYADFSTGCIQGGSDTNCAYTRIQNCRVYKTVSSSVPMFNFGGCSDFGRSVISGNISSGSNNISLHLPTAASENYIAVYGHVAIDITSADE